MNLQRAKIIEGLRNLAKAGDAVISGEVKSVDEAQFTCTVTLPSGQELEEVQLKALKETAKSVVMIPKLGATVQLLHLGKGEFYMLAAEAVDKVLLDAEVEVVFNGGENGGVPIVQAIMDNLNELKNYIKQTLEPAIKDGITLVGVGSAANGTTGATAFTSAVATKQISFSDMANKKVKH